MILHPVEIEVAVRYIQGNSVTLLLVKMWCLAKEIKATGVDLEVSLANMVEPVSELKNC